MTPDTKPTWGVPELGPSLGRLVDPGQNARGALGVPLDDIRQELVTALFDLAGAARAFAAAGDRDGVVSSLGRVAWLGLWEKAVGSAAARIAGETNAGLRLAAEESRFPRRRLAGLLLSDEDTRAIAARLGSGGAPLVAALDALEQAANASAGRAPADAASRTWQAAVAAAARRLESAWMALEEASQTEQAYWAAEVTRVRRWRRPAWPVWTVTAVLVAAALYLGLVLGGYLPVPPPLRGLASLWWTWL